MKKPWAVVLVVIAMACGKDDPAPSYAFKAQIAAGKIENVSWTFVEGKAEDNGDDLSIDLMLEQTEAPCDIFGLGEGDMVFFTIPDAVGLYELSISSNNSQTATLFDEDDFVNVIAVKGAIEILTITATEVTGRVDLQSDNENYINGNFTVTLCP